MLKVAILGRGHPLVLIEETRFEGVFGQRSEVLATPSLSSSVETGVDTVMDTLSVAESKPSDTETRRI